MAEMKDSGIEWIGDIPQNWKLKRIQFCLDEINEKNIPIKTEQVLSLVKDKGVMLYEDKGNQGNKAKEDVSQYKIAYPNTLIVNSMNILIGSVGISNYLGCVSPVYYVFKENEDSDLRYINYIFNTREFQKELRKYANGILEIRLRVSSSDIFKRKIPFPDKHIQTKIANFLDKKCAEIDALHTDIEKQIETLEEYKKSIITEAVTKGLDPDVEMKDSGISYIGNIPKHWKVTNLKYLGKCQNGISKGGEYFGNGFPFVSYGDVYKNYSIPQNVDGLIMSTKTEQNIYSVKYGDVFFTRTSETIEEIGFASTCLKSIDNSVFAGFLIRFRPTSSDLIPEFSKFYFRSNIHRKFFVKEMNLVTRASLSQNLLGRLPVLLPPLCEQQMIAKNLEKKCAEIDGAIEEKKEQLETLEQYKKSLIYEYVTGKKEVK